MSHEFAQFRRQLEEEGWFEPAPLHVAYRVLEVVAMHLLGVYLFTTAAWPLGFLVLGIVEGRCGWLMHEGGHYSLTGVPKVDVRLQEFLYGVGCGMSGGWWRVQHNKHHATPQKLAHDADLYMLPLVSFNKAVNKALAHPPGGVQAR